jgi:GTPase SAR1 family protein
MASKINAEYWEASAKFNDNVRELFERLAAVLFEKSLMQALASPNHQTAEIGRLSKYSL